MSDVAEFDPIFKGRDFTLTADDVSATRQEIEREAERIQELLKSSNPQERSFGNGAKPLNDKQVEFWGAHGDDQLLEIARQLYNRGTVLEVNSGTPTEEVIADLREDPNVKLIDPLIRKDAWGHLLKDSMARLALKELQDSSEHTLLGDLLSVPVETVLPDLPKRQ